MKKIVITVSGGYSKIKILEFDDLIPKDTEVLVDIKYVGINFADVVIRQGLYASAKEYVGWPITPGFEFSGIVKEVGKSTSKFKKGDEVFGVTLFNAYASEISIPENQLFKKPTNLSLKEAAGFPTVFITAYYAIYLNVYISKGMDVLIHSAAGGMGTALLQLSKVAGFNTVGVVGSTHKIKVAKDAGADVVIDKSKDDLWKKVMEINPKGFDLIFDGNGPSTLKKGYNHLKPTGKMICYGYHSMFSKKGGFPNYLKLAYEYLKIPRFNPLDLTNDNKSIVSFNLSFLFDRIDILEFSMNELLKLVEDSKIKPPPVQVYKFEEVCEAQKRLESGMSTGKIVLKV